MFSWHEKRAGVIAPDERLPWLDSLALGLQHTLAMFGSTVVAPLLMGFPPNTAIFFSGLATILFFFIVGGNVPSYLGSSFAFIGPVLAAMGGAGKNIPVALGGIVAAGLVYAVIALVTMLAGTRWIDVLMPAAVTGAIVMVIGLNLAGAGASDISGARNVTHATITAIVTLGVAILAAVYLPGFFRRLPILLGGIAGYLTALMLGDITFTPVAQAAWVGLPQFTFPVFDWRAVGLIAPVAIVLIAENTGHVKAVGQITDRNLDPYLGRAFLGDALATVIAGFFGGTGVTTYAENIGVMAMTRVYSTLIFLIASVVALLLGLCPKFGALVGTIPAQAPGILGGLSIVLFGLIAATGARIWVENGVDFGRSRNLIMAGVTLILGTGAYALNFGAFSISGIALAAIAAIVLYQLLREPVAPETEDERVRRQATAPADAAVEPAGQEEPEEPGDDVTPESPDSTLLPD